MEGLEVGGRGCGLGRWKRWMEGMTEMEGIVRASGGVKAKISVRPSPVAANSLDIIILQNGLEEQGNGVGVCSALAVFVEEY